MGITDTVKWKAVYNDETSLSERDPNGGKEHAFKEIDMSKIQSFQLINEKDVPVCQVRLGNGKRLIFARRNLITTGQLFKDVGGRKVPIPTKTHQRIIILGWQKTVNGVNTKAIFYLLADGRIEMDDEWKTDAVHYRVSTPGLLPEPELIPTKIVDKKEPQEKAYSGSNDSAFKNKK